MSIEPMHQNSPSRQVFQIFHGMYGNLFLDKFRTGDLNDSGKDKGIVSAQKVWDNDLERYDALTIRRAAEACKQRHKTFAPSLPEFLDLCRACAPKETAKPNVPQIAMSDEMKAKIKQQNREMLANLKLGATVRTDYGTGMPALLLMVAKAIGDAGGDEVKSLLALEAKFLPSMVRP